MCSINVLRSLVCLSAYYLSVLALNPILRQPSNGSLAAIGLGNDTLGAWPSRLPWISDMGGDLSMDFEWYGDYASPARWTSIRSDLDDIIHTIENDVYSAHFWAGHLNHYHRADVSISVDGVGSLGISPIDAVKILQATKGVFFTFNYKPREFSAEIKISRQSASTIRLRWPAPQSRWPE